MTSDKDNKELIEALCSIATGFIVGERKNYRDSLQIVRDIAKDALKKEGIDIDDLLKD